MLRKLSLVVAAVLLFPLSALAANCPSFTYTLTNGTTADANQVMANFNTLLTCANNSLANSGVNTTIIQLTGLTTPLSVPQGGTGSTSFPANSVLAGNGSSPVTTTLIGTLLRNYIAGLTLSNDSATPNSVLDISAGSAMDSTNVVMMSTAAFTKATGGAWAAGSSANGMGNGLTIASNTWYHVFEIINAGVADIYFDTSVTAANAPASTSNFRRIGSFKTDGSAHIIGFYQTGNTFGWKTPTNDIAVSNLGTVQTAYTLNVPPGVVVTAKIRGFFLNTSASSVILITPPQETGSTAVSTPSGNVTAINSTTNTDAGFQIDVLTNTSEQINAVTNNNSTTFTEATYGWTDPRGQSN